MARRVRRSSKKNAGGLKNVLLKILSLLVCLLFISVFVGYFVAKSYLEGDSFRATIEEEVQRELKVDRVQLKPLSFDGAHIGTAGVQVTTDAWIKSLVVNGLDITVDRGDLWNRLLHMNEIVLNQVKLDLDLDRLDVPPPEFPEKPESFFTRFTPQTMVFDKVNFKEFSLNIYKGEDVYSATNLRIKVLPVSKGKEMVMDVTGGHIVLPYAWLKSVQLVQANLRYHPDRITLVKSSFQADPGEIEIEGEWVNSLQTWSGTLIVRNAELSHLLEDDWKKSLTGRLYITGRLKGDARGLANVRSSVKLEKANLMALPILDKLAAFAKTARFRSISFNEAHAQLNYDGKLWMVEDLVLASEGLLRVEGNMTIDSRQNIQGSLFIGLPAGLLTHIPGAEEQIFLASNNGGKMGLLWARVNISGTLDDPQEDLSARMLTAAGMRMFDKAAGSGKQILKFTQSIADSVLNDARGPKLDEDEKPKSDKPEEEEGGLLKGGIDRVKEAGELISPLKIF